MIILTVIFVAFGAVAPDITDWGDIDMFHPGQFRRLIKESLRAYGEMAGTSPAFWSDDAVELLMLTAAQESHLGRYLEQVNGPALGVFQVEPNTLHDIYLNYLRYKPPMREALEMFITPVGGGVWSLYSNLAYQVLIARLVYWRVPNKIPSKESVEDMAAYWKRYYNTILGKGTIAEATGNYKRFVLEGERT